MRTMTNKTLFFAACAALICTPALAQDGLEAKLSQLASLDGQAYVDARDALLAEDGVAEALAARPAAWTAASWRTDAVAAALAVHASQPELAAKVYALPGVKAQVYLTFRKPGPNAFRHVRNLGPAAAPVLAEVLFKTEAVYPFGSVFPATMAEEMQASYVEAEKQALTDAVAFGLGSSKHPVARFVLGAMLQDDARNISDRIAAAAALGQSQDVASLPALQAVAASDAPLNVRAASVAAMGKLPSADSLEALKGFVTAEADAVRRAAVGGLGLLGSPWAWESRGGNPDEADLLREEIAAVLLDVIANQGDQPGVAELAVSSLCTVAHPSSKAPLEALVDDETQTAGVRAVAKNGLYRLNKALARQSR